MAEEPQAAPTAAPKAAEAPQMRVLAQYVKDLSFENPDAPNSMRAGLAAPAIDLGIDVQARRADEQSFEVDLNIEAKAERDGKVVFLVELKYSGLFQLVAIPNEQIEPIVLIECPRILFPFARRVLADITRDGGFPPLFVDPIDFAALYRNQRMGDAGSAAGSA